MTPELHPLVAAVTNVAQASTTRCDNERVFGSRAIAREVAQNREVTERLFADLHQFMREERLRANKLFEPMIRNLEELRASHNELRASHNELRASHNELIGEIRAQRDGLLALIDEMRGGGRPGGAAA